MRNFSAASQLQVRLKTGNLYSIEEFQTSNCRVRCASFHPIHSNVLACGLRPLRKNLIKTHKEIHENNLNSHSFCRDILVRLTAKYHLFDDF